MRGDECFLCRFLGNWCQGSLSWVEGTATTSLLTYERMSFVRITFLRRRYIVDLLTSEQFTWNLSAAQWFGLI
jgi:hypothetical protein